MRNLKKILALVLALVMSFSLMATASAFSDDGDIAADYAEAIDVLSGLEVFKGYDNGATFQPKGSITRAEVAAIIYRIATGDVKDAQTSIYSSWGQFNDVKDGSWYAGYVNYCANAGYIKGYDSKTFGPNDPVTGYQALAMILRAIGYDKNNEFTGSNWQVRTASIAKQRGITDNVTDTLLGQSATRELVAEVLFQSILVKTVTFNTNTLSYSENATSLGYDVLKLERLEGVVVANQFADIADDADEGLATGKTRIETADGDRTLNVVTTLDDIGESRYVYGIKTSNNGYNLVTEKMYDTGDNVIADKGEEIKVKDLAKEQSISVNDNTEYFVNFDQSTDKWTSEYLIRYAVAQNSITDTDWQEFLRKNAKTDKVTYTYRNADGETETITYDSWVRTIKPETEFEDEDKEIMKDIFYSADRKVAYDDDTLIARFTLGEVYVGTTSLKDYSDTLSWKEFRTQYILEDLRDFDKTTNGNYLKLVDNNNDGIVEYALRTDYVLDQVVSVTTKDNKDTYYYETLKDDDDVVTPDGGEVKFALNDVIIYAPIDGKNYAEVVTPVNATVKAVNFKDEEITTTDDSVYGQSDIYNDTVMDDSITAMDEQVEYNMYLDKFGFVRAYKLAQGSQYGLLTEMYPSRNFNGAYVNNGYWIAELMAGEDKAPAEYNVLNSYYGRNDAWQYLRNTNPFIRVQANGNAFSWSGSLKDGHTDWTNGATTGWNGYAYNYLREATGHLGMVGEQTAQFDYDPLEPVNTGAPTEDQNLVYTNTNVAKYTKTEDGVNLYSATEYKYENGAQVRYADLDNNDIFEKYTLSEYITAYKKAVNATTSNTDIEKIFNALRPVYAVDYIQLAVENIKAGAAHYTIDKNYATNGNQADPEDYNLINYYGSNNFVDAVDDTEFFIVSGRSIQHIVGYKNMPKIDAKNIRSIYAVAENVNVDRENRDYWVANVIVIEVNKEFNYDSVVMAWANPSQASYQAVAQANGQKAMSVVDSENTSIDTLIPDYISWNTMWTNYGFYGVYDSAERDANTLTGSIDPLGVNGVGYNDNGVYAGTVQRESVISGSRAGYIDIFDGVNYKTNLYVGDARIYAVGYSSSTANYPTLKELRSYKELTNNDKIIYVENAKGDISFIVDVSHVVDSKWVPASWLASEWDNIIAEQRNTTSGLVTFAYPTTNKIDASGDPVKDDDGNIVQVPDSACYQGETFVDKFGVEHKLPDTANNGYDPEDWTDGTYVYIPDHVYNFFTEELLSGSYVKDLFKSVAPNLTYKFADGTCPGEDDVTNVDANDNRIMYKGVQCTRIQNNYKDVIVTVEWKLADNVTKDTILAKGVKVVDGANKAPATSKVIDKADLNVTLMSEGTVMTDAEMYRTLAADDSRYVRVDFKLNEGYFNPTVKVTVDGATHTLRVYDNEKPGCFTVYFKWSLDVTKGRPVVEISADSQQTGTYNVSLDTEIPDGVTVVEGNYTYKVAGDTAVLVVKTDVTYQITADTSPDGLVDKITYNQTSDTDAAGNTVVTWFIKLFDVKGNVKVHLTAKKK